jgi:hypothetical protein
MNEKQKRKQKRLQDGVQKAALKLIGDGEKLSNKNILKNLSESYSYTDISPVLRELKNNAFQLYFEHYGENKYLHKDNIAINLEQSTIPFWVFEEYKISFEEFKTFIECIEKFGKYFYTIPLYLD